MSETTAIAPASLDTLATEPEVVSETISKKPRGRPRLYDDQDSMWNDMTNAGCMSTGATSRRQTQNACYAHRAYWLLGDDVDRGGRFGWLRLRNTILGALGRIKHPDDVRIAAERICEEKPTSKQAITMIRCWNRGGVEPTPSVEGLELHIRRAVRDYWKVHPSTTREQVLAAVDKAYEVIDRVLSSET